MTTLYVILALSVPVFYLVGLFTFISAFFKNGTKEKLGTSQLEKLLKRQAFENPTLTIAKFLENYEKNAGAIVYEGETAEVAKPTSVLTTNISDLASNWYSDNSINVLLYIGAFLIVASASIFVGFQWDRIDPVTKATLVTIFTFLWFLFGAWFYAHPKIKNAGLTFLGIGSVLIPFAGLGWYNFVLKPAAVPFSIVWIATSIVAGATYIALTTFIKKPFFTYLANLAGLSLALAFVNQVAYADEFYILAAMGVALALVCLSIFIPTQSEETKVLVHEPLIGSANLLMPLALIYGFSTAVSRNNLFTAETTLALCLAIMFYIVSFFHQKKPLYMLAAQVLIFAQSFIFMKWQNFDTVNVLYLWQILAFGFAGWAYVLRDKVTQDNTVGLSIVASLLTYLATFAVTQLPSDQILFSGSTVLICILVAQFFKRSHLRYVANGFIYLTVFHFLKLIGISNNYYPLVFSGISYGLYAFSYIFTDVEIKAVYAQSGLIGAFFSPFIVYLYPDYYEYQYWVAQAQLKQREWFGLLAAYLGVGLFGFESFLKRLESVAYFTAGIGVGTLLWHLKLLGVEELQWYTAPIALYFFVIAFLRKRKADLQWQEVLDTAGLFFLLLPTTFQAFDKAVYALLLGIYGSILIGFGNTFKNRLYIYGAAAAIFMAVFSQTYEYLLSLERWIITGVAGLTFIIVAVYLLWYRKEK